MLNKQWTIGTVLSILGTAQITMANTGIAPVDTSLTTVQLVFLAVGGMFMIGGLAEGVIALARHNQAMGASIQHALGIFVLGAVLGGGPFLVGQAGLALGATVP